MRLSQRGRRLTGGVLLPLALLAAALTASPAVAAPTAVAATTVPGDPPLPSYPGLAPRAGQPAALAVTTTPTPCDNNGADRSLTRDEVLTRASSWLSVGIPYSQERCYRNGYGDYRTDCSGFVSMAWGLGGSGSAFWTGNLRDRSDVIARSTLQPGDALLRHTGDPDENHVALFVRWADSARTQPVVMEQTGSSDTIQRTWTASYAGLYTPVRYVNIKEDNQQGEAGPGAVWANGEHHVFGVSPSGNLSQNTWRSNGGWLGWETLGGTVEGTPAVVYHDGRYEVFAHSPSGIVYQKTWNGTWSGWTSIGGIVEGGLAATYVNGELRVFGISPSGNLAQNVRPSGAGWQGWETLGGTVEGTPAAVYHDGQYDVFAHSPSGIVYQKTLAGGVWSEWKSIGG
ncbi:hypothetical protein, partial [Asanoa iriomotensis]